ncbi:MAG: glycosyltransferase family 4 protein [Chloroflexota bacterium]
MLGGDVSARTGLGEREVREAARPLVSHVITLGDPMTGAQLNTLTCLQKTQARYGVELVMGCDGPMRQACHDRGIRALVIPFKNTMLAPFADIRAIVALIRHFRRVHPEIVQTHSSKAGVLGRIAARLAGVPIVVHTWHGPSFHETQPPIVQFVLRSLERLLSGLTDFHVCVADTLRADLIDSKIAVPERIATVRSGIRAEPFRTHRADARREIRRELNISAEAPVIISVGTLQANKAHHLLIEAARRLLHRYPDSRFLIAGPAVMLESEVPGDLQRRIDQAAIGDRVQLLGSRQDVPSLLAASDIFVLTSWREGLPRSVIEALCSGLPVIATDTGSTRDVVVEGGNGFLIGPGDVDALTDRLERLLADKPLRGDMAAQASRFDATSWSPDEIGKTYVALYQHLLEHAAPSGDIRMGASQGEA